MRVWSACALMTLVGFVGCARPVAEGPRPDLALAKDIRLTFRGESAADGGSTQAASTGTGWATIRGTFLYDGDPPTRKPVNVTKDQSFCMPGGKAPLSEELVVDESTRGIANIAIYLRKKPQRINPSVEAHAETVPYDQKVCTFLTHMFPVVVGQTMEIKNSDPGSHNTSIAETTFNRTIPKGGSATYKVVKKTALPTKVTCGIHPWMLGYFLALDHGYVGVTAKDGAFEIKNLPAGEELEFQVWHESSRNPNGFLILDSSEAKALNWSNRGRFKIKLEENETRELNFSVPASAFSG